MERGKVGDSMMNRRHENIGTIMMMISSVDDNIMIKSYNVMEDFDTKHYQYVNLIHMNENFTFSPPRRGSIRRLRSS